jgi:hypothetical protein
MSVSTTTTVSAGVRELLQAYDLHHSGTESSQSQNVEATTHPRRQPENRPSWPSNRRRMPPYREASRSHRLADRPAGETTAGGVLITVMFLGVYVDAVSSLLGHC